MNEKVTVFLLSVLFLIKLWEKNVGKWMFVFTSLLS